MLESIIQRLELAEERFKFLEGEISSSRVISDQKTYSSYTKAVSYTHLTLPTILLV